MSAATEPRCAVCWLPLDTLDEHRLLFGPLGDRCSQECARVPSFRERASIAAMAALLQSPRQSQTVIAPTHYADMLAAALEPERESTP